MDAKHTLRRTFLGGISGVVSGLAGCGSEPDAIAFLLDHGIDIEAVRTDHDRIGHGSTDEVMLARTLEAASPVFGRG